MMSINFNNILEAQAKSQADTVAFSFLRQGKKTKTINYGELYQRSQALARRLMKQCKPGDRVMLILPPGLDYIVSFLACLQARIIAVPCYPPVNPHFSSILCHVMEDCQPKVLLTNLSLSLLFNKIIYQQKFHDLFDRNVDHNQVTLADCLAKSKTNIVYALNPFQRNRSLPNAKSQDIAFLQYSSGTTGKPKGIMVTHQNIIENLAVITDAFQNTKETTSYFWLPPYHDMGLIGGILETIYVGYHAYIRSPFEFVANPSLWLNDINRYRITTSGAPNFAYSLCAKIDSNKLSADLDLSCWKTAFCGAEVIQEKVMQSFIDKFANFGFDDSALLPCYGMAETTLFATGKRDKLKSHCFYIDKTQLSLNKIKSVDNRHQDVIGLVASGINHEKQQLVIVDPESHEPLPDNHVGKIMLQSKSITKGYWNQPDLTEKSYHNPLNGYEGHFLDTGDLGAMVDNQLIVTGRLKDTIIVNGFNYNTSLIEDYINKSSPIIRTGGSAVVQIERGEHSGIIALIEINTIDADINFRSMAQIIRKKVLSAHQLLIDQIYFLPKRSIIKTTSGKISHHHCIQAINNQYLKPIYRYIAKSSSHHGKQRLLKAYKSVSKKVCKNHILKIVSKHYQYYLGETKMPQLLKDANFDSMTSIAFITDIERSLHNLITININDISITTRLNDFVDMITKQLMQQTVLSNDNFGKTKDNQLPLLPMQYFYLTHVKVQKFHLGKVLDLMPQVSSQQLRMALHNVIAIQPYLHCKVNSTDYKLTPNPIEKSYSWHDIELAIDDNLELMKCFNDIADKLCQETNYYQGNLLAVAYIHNTATQTSHAIVVINHLVIDPVSFYYLLKQLDMALDNKDFGFLDSHINQCLSSLDLQQRTPNSAIENRIANKNNLQKDEKMHIIRFDEDVCNALIEKQKNNSCVLDAIFIQAFSKVANAIFHHDVLNLTYIRDGHNTLQANNLVTFSCLANKLAIDCHADESELSDLTMKKLVDINTASMVEQTRYDKHSLSPIFEYSNMGRHKLMEANNFNENGLFYSGYLTSTFDPNMVRYRDIFIRPFFLGENQIQVVLFYASLIYSVRQIQLIDHIFQQAVRRSLGI